MNMNYFRSGLVFLSMTLVAASPQEGCDQPFDNANKPGQGGGAGFDPGENSTEGDLLVGTNILLDEARVDGEPAIVHSPKWFRDEYQIFYSRQVDEVSSSHRIHMKSVGADGSPLSNDPAQLLTGLSRLPLDGTGTLDETHPAAAMGLQFTLLVWIENGTRIMGRISGNLSGQVPDHLLESGDDVFEISGPSWHPAGRPNETKGRPRVVWVRDQTAGNKGLIGGEWWVLGSSQESQGGPAPVPMP